MGPAELISPGDLRDDAFVVSIGMVGAPTVTLEQLPTVDEAIGALNRYESVTESISMPSFHLKSAAETAPFRPSSLQ